MKKAEMKEAKMTGVMKEAEESRGEQRGKQKGKQR
jgi:hypothetical protein